LNRAAVYAARPDAETGGPLNARPVTVNTSPLPAAEKASAVARALAIVLSSLINVSAI